MSIVLGEVGTGKIFRPACSMQIDDYGAAYRPVRGYVRLLLRAARARNNAARLACFNRARDYLRLAGHAERLSLHRDLAEILYRAAGEWPAYDYGEGYFYQGLAAAGITGLRSTEMRVRGMGLPEVVAGKSVLDIGCNAGFMSLAVADRAAEVVGIDINPFLAEIGNRVARYLGAGNARFVASGFEDFDASDQSFDVVMSLANHSTFDRLTRYSLEAYFDRCAALAKPGGFFVFESHAPAFEGDGIHAVCDMIGARFAIRERRILDGGTFYDKARTFILGERRA